MKANEHLKDEGTEEGLILHAQLLVGVAAVLGEIHMVGTPWLRTRWNLLTAADTSATITIGPNSTVEEKTNANAIDEDGAEQGRVHELPDGRGGSSVPAHAQSTRDHDAPPAPIIVFI